MGEIIAFPGQPQPEQPEEPEPFDVDMTLLNIGSVAVEMQNAEASDLTDLCREMHRLVLAVEDYLNGPA